MARPSFLKDLPVSARKAYDFIRSAHRQGISARAMEPVIRATLTPISRTTINHVVEGIKGIKRGVADLRFLKANAIPDPRRMRIAKGDIATNFSFTLRIDGINPVTGLLEERFTQVVTDKNLSRNQIFELADKTIAGDEGSIPFGERKFTMEEALISEKAALSGL